MDEDVIANLVSRFVADTSEYISDLGEVAKVTSAAAASVGASVGKVNDVTESMTATAQAGLTDVSAAGIQAGKAVATGMGEAASAANASAKAVEAHSKEVKSFTDKVKEYAEGAVGALESWKLFKFVESSHEVFEKAETAMIRFEATLRSNGRNVEKLTEQYNKFIKQMRELIPNMGAGTIRGLLQTAEMFGLTGDAAQKAAKDAIGLAGATGQSAEHLIRLTAMMAQGDVQRARMFARMIPQLRGVKNEQEFLAEYQKLVNNGLETASALADTHAGKMEQVNLVYKGLQKEMGEIVASVLAPIAQMTLDIYKAFSQVNPEIKRFIFLIAGAIVGAIAFWGAMNSGMALFNMLSGGILTVIGVFVALGAIVGVWAMQFESTAEAVEAVQRWFQMLLDNWYLAFPVIYLIYTALRQLWELGVVMWEAIRYAADVAWEAIGGTVMEVWEGITEGATSLWRGVSEVFYAIWSVVKTVFNLVRPLVVDVLGEIWSTIKLVGRDLLKIIWDAIKIGLVPLGITLMGIKSLLESLGIEVSLPAFLRTLRLIRDSIYFLEYSLKNFSVAWDVLVAYLAYKLALLESSFKHLGTVVVAAFEYVGNEIESVFMQVFGYLRDAFFRFISAMVNTILALPALVDSKNVGKDLAEIWKDAVPPGGLRIQINPFVPPGKPFDPAVDALFQEWERRRDEFLGGFPEFMRQKFLEGLGTNVWEIFAKKAGDVGDGLAGGIKEANKEMAKFDHALTRSVEGVHRVQEFQARLRGEVGGGAGGGGDFGGELMGRVVPGFELFNAQPERAQAVAFQGQDRGEELAVLKDIRGLMQDQVDQPRIMVEDANLG